MKIKTFLSKWKQGIEQITPFQQLEAQQKGNWVMLVGLIAGIIVMFWKFNDYWWVEIILSAALFNHSLTMIGIWQKIKLIKKIERGGD